MNFWSAGLSRSRGISKVFLSMRRRALFCLRAVGGPVRGGGAGPMASSQAMSLPRRVLPSRLIQERSGLRVR